jgi:hypothetical protein
MFLKDWDPAEATIKEAGVTSIEVIETSSQGTTEAGLLGLELLETTHVALTGGKAGVNLSTERPGSLIDSPAL